MPTIDEYDAIIDKQKDKKAPGLDGLPIEFDWTFGNKIREFYYRMIAESWEHGILPCSTRTSVLSTIYKADEWNTLANYRPLSLTNCDAHV